jgi:hypothetical protein
MPAISPRISEQLAAELRQFSHDSKISQSQLVAEALVLRLRGRQDIMPDILKQLDYGNWDGAESGTS